MEKEVRWGTRGFDSSPARSRLIAGELCLEFANTAGWHASDHPQESLNRYEDLLSWCRRARLVDTAGAGRLLREARRRPAAAARAVRRAISIREIIYRIFVALLRGQPPARSDLEAFNRAVSSALKHLRVVPVTGRFIWSWEGGQRALDGVLWPILRSAADLLTSERRDRVGQCADDRGCGWLFLDRTKNRSRRWCDMEDCGNRAKARRHYQRIRSRSHHGKTQGLWVVRGGHQEIST